MKKLLFNKYFLGLVMVASISILLLGASNMADLVNPDRVKFRQMQEQREKNELLLLELQEEHEKLVEVRDKLNTKLGEMNAKIFEVEKKGEEIRKTNDNITKSIEGGETKQSILPQANASELDEPIAIKEVETQENANKEAKRPYKKNASAEQQEKVDYAWGISKDPYFIYLLEAENGLWTHDRRHNPINNTVGVDWGLCGTNDYFHPTRTNNPLFFSDWKWQTRECLTMFKGGTKFYGANPDNRAKASLNFIWE